MNSPLYSNKLLAGPAVPINALQHLMPVWKCTIDLTSCEQHWLNGMVTLLFYVLVKCLQLSLGVTVLLALTVFLLLVAETLPTQSDSVPLIGQYIPGDIDGLMVVVHLKINVILGRIVYCI